VLTLGSAIQSISPYMRYGGVTAEETECIDADRNSVSVSVTAPKLAISLVSVTAVIVKHGFGLLSVTAETTTKFRREPKLSLIAIR